MTRAILRSCAIGGGHHIGHNSRSFGGQYFCPKHLRQLFEGFDPQPYPARDHRVRFINGPDTEWCVLAREGDTLTLRRLGFPDDPPTTAVVAQVYPAGYPFHSVTSGCGR